MNYTKPDRNLRQSLVYSKSPPYTAISASWYAHVSRASDVCIAACVSRPVTEKDTALLVNPDNSAWQLGQVSRLGATRTRLQLRRDGGNKVCVCESKRCVQKTLTEKDFGPWRARGKTVSRSGPGERFQPTVARPVGLSMPKLHPHLFSSSKSWSGGKFSLHLLQRTKTKVRLLLDEARVQALWCTNLVIV